MTSSRHPTQRSALITILVLALITVLTACSAVTPMPLPTVTSAVTPHIGVTIVATQNTSPSPQSPTLVPTSSPDVIAATVTVTSACPAPNPNAVLPAKPATYTDTEQSLTTYLNAGAEVSATVSALKSWGVIYEAPNTHEQLGTVMRAKVLPGSDEQTIAVYYDPADQQKISRHGELIVYQCSGGSMQIAYRASADADFAGQVTNPRVFSTDEVTGDGIGDLSFIVGDCGNDTCYDSINIMTAVTGTSGTMGTLRNAIADFEYVPFPSFTYVPAANGTAKDLVVHPGYVGSPDAGPQRDVTDTWTYSGNVFTLTQEVKEPPVYRIHALQDADEAFRHKDFATANALYQRVANDPSLQPWEGNAPLRDEPQVLAAFAYVRMMQTAAAAGDTASLQAAHDALTMAVTSQSPGGQYLKLGEAFYKSFSQTKNMKTACAETVTYASKNQNTFLILGQDTFGSANEDYGAEDMCIAP